MTPRQQQRINRIFDLVILAGLLIVLMIIVLHIKRVI